MLIKLSPWQDDAIFLILLSQYVVSLDIAVTIADARPGAKVIRASSVEEALEKVREFTCIEAAFIANSMMAEASPLLVPALTVRGGRIVVVGAEVGDGPFQPAWKMLNEPFVSRSVTDLVEHPSNIWSLPLPESRKSPRRWLRNQLAFS